MGKTSSETEESASNASQAPPAQHVGTLVELLWNVTVLDVEYTLRHVCIKILKDVSVSDVARNRRTKALLELGEVFCSHGRTTQAGISEFTEKVHERMQAEINTDP